MTLPAPDDSLRQLLAAGFDVDTASSPKGPWQPPAPASLAGIFPRLEVLELIGSGGMGAVYKARQPHLDRLVALKLLAPVLGQDAAFVERFRREALVLARLDHPHIVAIHDIGEAGGWQYLLMEYVDGANLRQAMATGSFSPSEVLALIPQLCIALTYAHGLGVVHRDLKPENILLDRQGHAHIVDFGLAKLGRTDAADPLTRSGQLLGTAAYMAPEQVAGAKGVDHRADLYALGVLLYELLTGQLPLGRFEPPSQRVQVDVRLDEVVLRALERSPEQRWQSAAEVGKALGDLKTPPTVTVTAPARRNRPWWGTVAMVACLLVYVLGLFLVYARPSPISDPGPSPTVASPPVLAPPAAPATGPNTRVDVPAAVVAAPSAAAPLPRPAPPDPSTAPPLPGMEPAGASTATLSSAVNKLGFKDAVEASSRGPNDGVAAEIESVTHQALSEIPSAAAPVPDAPPAAPRTTAPPAPTSAPPSVVSNPVAPPVSAAVPPPAETPAPPAPITFLEISGPGSLLLEAKEGIGAAAPLQVDPGDVLASSLPGGGLRLEVKRSHAHVAVHPTSLTSIRLSGNGNLDVRGLRSERLRIENAGNGRINASELAVGSLDLQLRRDVDIGSDHVVYYNDRPYLVDGNGFSIHQGDVEVPGRAAGSMAVGGSCAHLNARLAERGGDMLLDDLRVADLVIVNPGNGLVRLGTGKAQRLVLTISGSSHLTAPGLDVEAAEITLSGSGSVRLGRLGALDAICTGSGDLRYFGNPRLGRIVTSH